MTDSFTPKTAVNGQYAWSSVGNWSSGALPDQNTVAVLNSTAAGYVLSVGGVYTVNQLMFGSGSGSLSLNFASGDSVTSGGSAVVVGGSTVTIAAASAGTLATNGLEVQAGATLNVLGGSFSSPNSGLTLDTGSTATFGPGVTLNINVLNLAGTATLNLDAGSKAAPVVIGSVNGSSTASTLDVSGGDLQLGPGGGGTFVVANSGVLEFTGGLGSSATIDLKGGLVQMDANTNLQSGTSFVFSGSAVSTFDVVSSNNFQNGFGYGVSGFDYGDKMQFGTLNMTGDTYVYSGTTLIVSSGTTQVLKLTNLTLASDAAAAHSFTLSGNTITLACFLSGTLIETGDGAVPVEQLQAGDLVVTVERGVRALRPVRWTGCRTIEAATFADGEDAWPVRICADAFSPGLPRRDLLVTGDHGMFVDGCLIPARMLVNGRTILRDTTMATYTVHHVELDRHLVLFAEGLPAESYLDTGNRASFGLPGSRRALPAQTRARRARRIRSMDPMPLAVEREVVEPVWQRLDRRADMLGLAPLERPELADDPDLGLLLEDGRVLRPRWHDRSRHLFHVPRHARPVRLLSRASRPSDVIGPFVDDRRRLGVSVCRITLWRGLFDTVVPAADLQGVGWYGLEDRHRWTDGQAALSMPAVEHVDSFVEVQLAAQTRYLA